MIAASTGEKKSRVGAAGKAAGCTGPTFAKGMSRDTQKGADMLGSSRRRRSKRRKVDVPLRTSSSNEVEVAERPQETMENKREDPECARRMGNGAHIRLR